MKQRYFFQVWELKHNKYEIPYQKQRKTLQLSTVLIFCTCKPCRIFCFGGRSEVQYRFNQVWLRVWPVQHTDIYCGCLNLSVFTQSADMWPRPSPWYRPHWLFSMSHRLYLKRESSHLWSLSLFIMFIIQFVLKLTLNSALHFQGRSLYPRSCFCKNHTDRSPQQTRHSVLGHISFPSSYRQPAISSALIVFRTENLTFFSNSGLFRARQPHLVWDVLINCACNIDITHVAVFPAV